MRFSGSTASVLLPDTAKFVLEHGDETGSRNGRVREILNAQIEIERPYDREILVEGRGANVFAQIAETMWVLAGRSDIKWLSAYLPRAKDYSDNGVSWRGGYGPRIRRWPATSVVDTHGELDQLGHVVDLLKRDPLSRRAVIAIYDPKRDMFPSKDVPCNDFLQFQSRLGKLHMTVTVRSNDLMWGWSGINAFEWSTIQEIVASLLGIEVGPLVFNIGNLHIYERHWERASRLSYEDIEYKHFRFNPDRTIEELSEVDDLVDQWFAWEKLCREGRVRPEMLDEFTDPLFHSWAVAIAYYWTRWDEWLHLLTGTRLAAAIAKTPQSVLPVPVERSHGQVPGLGRGAGLSDRSRPFYDFVSHLHATKHESYGNSWKRRGEKMSILANIARKVDRLGKDDEYESKADTVIDLWVYLAKYLDWLNGGDSGPDAVNKMLHEGLSEYDDLPRDDRSDLKHVQTVLDSYMDTLEHNTVSRKSKIEFLQITMRKVLPIAVDLWRREQGVPDETPPVVWTDEYRGADRD